MCISQGLQVQEDSGGGWNPACPPPAQPPTAAQVFFDPINRAFSQVHLPGHRRCALRRHLPIEQVTESLNRLSVALMKTIRTGFQVPSFFQKGGESTKSLFNRIPVSSEHGSRFSPGWHQEHTLTPCLAQKPNTPSSLCIGPNSSHCLNYFQVVKWGISSGLSGA